MRGRRRDARAQARCAGAGAMRRRGLENETPRDTALVFLRAICLHDVFHKRRPHVIELIEKRRIDLLDVSECQPDIEARARLPRRPEGIAIALSSRATI